MRTSLLVSCVSQWVVSIDWGWVSCRLLQGGLWGYDFGGMDKEAGVGVVKYCLGLEGVCMLDHCFWHWVVFLVL